VQIWDLMNVSGEPTVLLSTPEARCVVLDIARDAELGDHQVHERTLMLVLDGSVTVTTSDSSAECSRGTLVHLTQGESRRVHARERARVLLTLTPWPAPDHYDTDERKDPHQLPADATLSPDA
jgi:quercetin dioxygenase-like cupin family protein